MNAFFALLHPKQLANSSWNLFLQNKKISSDVWGHGHTAPWIRQWLPLMIYHDNDDDDADDDIQCVCEIHVCRSLFSHQEEVKVERAQPDTCSDAQCEPDDDGMAEVAAGNVTPLSSSPSSSERRLRMTGSGRSQLVRRRTQPVPVVTLGCRKSCTVRSRTGSICEFSGNRPTSQHTPVLRFSSTCIWLSACQRVSLCCGVKLRNNSAVKRTERHSTSLALRSASFLLYLKRPLNSCKLGCFSCIR